MTEFLKIAVFRLPSLPPIKFAANFLAFLCAPELTLSASQGRTSAVPTTKSFLSRDDLASVKGHTRLLVFSVFSAVKLFCLALAALLVLVPAISFAQTATPQLPSPPVPPQLETRPPTLSLSPAVITARGAYGQGLTQTLSLSNDTGAEFAFELEAQDVVVKDGKRIFVTAGETEHSIASSAVFSQKIVVVKPYSSVSVDVRLTIPAQTSLRAVVALFRGTNKVPTSNSAVGMTASLGTLITFNLSENVKLQAETVRVDPTTDTSNLKIAQWITNTGTEPVLPEGMAVVLNDSGSLVGKSPFAPQRLLPGERLEFAAEFPEPLKPGGYKALCSFQFEGKTLTTDGAFKVP